MVYLKHLLKTTKQSLGQILHTSIEHYNVRNNLKISNSFSLYDSRKQIN